jgi:hypothetical protein
MNEPASIPASESEVSLSAAEPTVALRPKKRWHNQRDNPNNSQPLRLPLAPVASARPVRQRMKKSRQPHRIHPAVLGDAPAMARKPVANGLLEEFVGFFSRQNR